MPTLATQQAAVDSRGLVRKIQRGLGFLAPMTVDLPEKLTDTNGLPIDLKALGFLPIGIVSPEGYRFGRDIEKSDVDALGYSSYVRSDITRVARTVAFNALETGRRHLTELINGVDLSGVEQDSSGEIVWDEPDLPLGQEYRFLVVGDDGPADSNWVIGKGYGTVKLASVGEEAWSKEGALVREITLDVFTDEDLGTPVRHYLGGTGAEKYRDVLGFAAAGSGS